MGGSAVAVTRLVRARWRGWVSGAPATCAFLVTLLVTTATQAGLRPREKRSLVVGASTNLHNMTAHPAHSLVVSAFWVDSTASIVLMALLVVVVMGRAEHVLGTARTVLVFVVGHVGATVLSVAGIALGVDWGWLSRSLVYAVDVGPSYGLVALAAVLVMRLPHGQVRRLALAALLAGLLLVVAMGGDFTDVGHLLAALIGIGLAPRVNRPASKTAKLLA